MGMSEFFCWFGFFGDRCCRFDLGEFLRDYKRVFNSFAREHTASDLTLEMLFKNNLNLEE